MTDALEAWEQLPMYAVSEELAPRIAEFGLESNLIDLQEDGYTIISVDRDLSDRLRAAILRAVEDAPGPNSSFDRACAAPIGEDPVFEEAIIHPAVLALAEFICGRGCTLSSALATVRIAGSSLGLHCDQGHMAAPFPEHEMNLTACWVTDEFTRANGAFMIIPGTHRERRNPSPSESKALVGAVPVECPPGSVVLWNGAVWHGNYPRTAPGERVVFHATYTRLAYRPVHDFRYVTDDYRANATPELRGLLGENLGFAQNSRFEHIDAHRYLMMVLDSRR